MSKILGIYVEVEISQKEPNDWEKNRYEDRLVEDIEEVDKFLEEVRGKLKDEERVIKKVKNILIKCDCGEEILCTGFTNECDNCNELYNRWGQQLAPRNQWGEDTGEVYYDI